MIVFHISLYNHKLWYSLEVPCQGAANEYPQHTPRPLYNTIVGVHSINHVS